MTETWEQFHARLSRNRKAAIEREADPDRRRHLQAVDDMCEGAAALFRKARREA